MERVVEAARATVREVGGTDGLFEALRDLAALDALPEALRLLSHYARRAGYAEAVAEALCEQIERMHEPPIGVKNRHIRQEWEQLRASARRIQAALEMEVKLLDAMRVEHESVKERQHAAP
jgi:hypothetical protein